MRHSIYLTLATLLIKADLERELRQWKRKVRQSAYDLPWDNAHLLRDIGLEPDGRPIGIQEVDNKDRASRRVYKIRRSLSMRIPT
jgi:hypothetical protein